MVDQDDMNRRVLLSLFCGMKFEGDVLAQLTEEDWASIKKMAVTHRLFPMVYWNQKDNPDIPKEFIELACSSYKKNAMRSLTLQRELLFINDLFNKAGIKFIPLKGGYLAWFAYPQPALRVNRDIDILVPKESIEA
ncbi:MAG: nucleotidyltransferase family protein, partial [Magnetococcales bacterium]|nr:nucleotidyltransferase family protein [Magnetococcales bacterium]